MKIHFGLVSALALALAAPVFAHGGDAEALKVTSIEQVIDRMPVIDGEDRPVRTYVTIEAMSGGCTKAKDFDLRVEQKEDVQKITVIRKRPDPCETLAYPVSIQVETTGLETQKPVRVMNPFPVSVQTVH